MASKRIKHRIEKMNKQCEWEIKQERCLKLARGTTICFKRKLCMEHLHKNGVPWKEIQETEEK